MRQRRLGEAGPFVSEIGLGLAALGRPGYLNLGHGTDIGADRSVGALRQRVKGMLDAAHQRGITYLDAARSYGRAEEFLAAWLASAAGAGSMVIGSKWGYVYTADWQVDSRVHEVKVHTLDNLESQLEESRALLGDRLDLYQIHSATLDSGVLDDPRILARLARLRDDGVMVGASTSGPHQAEAIDRIAAIEVGGRPLFGAVQSTWNLLEPSAGGALARAAEAGLGVIVKEAVANGRLTSRNRQLAGRLEPLLGEWELDAVAIAAALANDWATVVLSGATTIDQLDANLRALAVPSDIIDGLDDLAELPDRYWSHRSGMAWT